jgi:23S rRNA pseudouridine1911/1915/1917 synthase
VNVKHKRFKAKKAYPRLDHFLAESLTGMSRTQAAGLIKANHIKLNQQPVSKKNLEIKPGDVVDVELEEPEEIEYQPTRQLKKLYEDDYILIIDKPSGISVHPGSGEPHETILDIFRYHYPRVNDMPDQERPGIVHRLDRDTSGVLLLAKDIRSMRRLQKQFKRREIHKTYLALVSGQMRYLNGVMDAPLARCTRQRTRYRVVTDRSEAPNAREAVTDYSVVRYYPERNFTFVRLFPHTGRTHQIRVHLAHFGNPVLGDPVYGNGRGFERLALHAYGIEFQHPVTGNVIQSCSVLPGEFRRFLMPPAARGLF